MRLQPGQLNLPNGTSRPATCKKGDIFADDSQAPGSNLYYCTATNTWTLVSGGGAASGITDGGAISYVTDNTDDFAFGGSTFAASACYVDESAELLQCGGTAGQYASIDGTNGLLSVHASSISATKPRIDIYDNANGATANKFSLLISGTDAGADGTIDAIGQHFLGLVRNDGSYVFSVDQVGADTSGDGTADDMFLNFPLADPSGSQAQARANFGVNPGYPQNASRKFAVDFGTTSSIDRTKQPTTLGTSFGTYVRANWKNNSVLDAAGDGTVDTAAAGLYEDALYVNGVCAYANCSAATDTIAGLFSTQTETEYYAPSTSSQPTMDLVGGNDSVYYGSVNDQDGDGTAGNETYGRVRDLFGKTGVVAQYGAGDSRNKFGVWTRQAESRTASAPTSIWRGTTYGFFTEYRHFAGFTETVPSVVGVMIVPPYGATIGDALTGRGAVTNYTGDIVLDVSGATHGRAAYFGGGAHIKSGSRFVLNGVQGLYPGLATSANAPSVDGANTGGTGATYDDASGIRGWGWNTSAGSTTLAMADLNGNGLYLSKTDGVSINFGDTDGTTKNIGYSYADNRLYFGVNPGRTYQPYFDMGTGSLQLVSDQLPTNHLGITNRDTTSANFPVFTTTNYGTGFTQLAFTHSASGSTKDWYLRFKQSDGTFNILNGGTTAALTITNDLATATFGTTNTAMPKLTTTGGASGGVVVTETGGAHLFTLQNTSATSYVLQNGLAGPCDGGANGGALTVNTVSAGVGQLVCSDDDGGAGGGGDNTSVNGTPSTDFNVIDTATIAWTLNTAASPDTAAPAVIANSIGTAQIDETQSYTWSGNETFSGSVTIPSGTSLPSCTGSGKIYQKTDATTGQQLYACESGTMTLQGGAPPTATYITQTAQSGLSAEQALSSLATGFVKVTTGTGVLSSQAAMTDADVPDNITIALAATATALATNGANCASGSYPLGVNASGAAESCTVANTGTVTSASCTTANGVSATVANPTTTPAFTFTLGAITPTSVTATGNIVSGGSVTSTCTPASNDCKLGLTDNSSDPTAPASGSPFLYSVANRLFVRNSSGLGPVQASVACAKSGATLDLAGCTAITLSGSSTVTTISNPVLNQEYTFLCAAGSTENFSDDASVVSGTLRLTAAFTCSDNDVFKLTFDGTNFRESGRWVN